MGYQAEISRPNPTALVFLVDQSGSMEEPMSSGRSKAQFVADALNRTLASLITKCTRSDGVRDYFHIGVVAYCGDGTRNGLSEERSVDLQPISRLEQSPKRVEDRQKKTDDGAGGIVEQPFKFPVWFDPTADGGTPMCAALREAASLLAPWCDAHPTSYPPTILHVTDGASTDGDPESTAGLLSQIETADGKLLLFNLHVSSAAGAPVKFPSSEVGLPDDFAKLLFRMSSLLPDHMAAFAREKGYSVSTESRGFMFNAEAPEVVDFFDIGTRATQLR